MDSIKIAVCDDERIFGKKVIDYVASYMDSNNIVCEIDFFHSGKEFAELKEKMQKYTIVFLDINMEEMDGIQTAKCLRTYCTNTFLVFVTAFIHYTLEGYKVEAIRYILKGTQNFEESMQECLDAILQKMKLQNQDNIFDFVEGKKVISLDSIYYIESKLHKLSFWMDDGGEKKEYTLYGTLNEWENKLQDSRWVRVHQSFLINMQYLLDVRNYFAELTDGSSIPVSRARYKRVRDRFAAYIGEL